ncbi:MAG TPA: M56 family metallopeptidase [Terriglobales bacterium]|nr:M56 family metallopeptidase [Terriglobales bacterium]
MFEARCIIVSLACFFLLYSALSAFVCLGWNLFCHRLRERPSDLLFALRIMPMVVSVSVTLGFVVPSFLLLEPRSIYEPLGTVLVTLGFGCLSLLVWGLCRGVIAQVKTSHALAAWLTGASRIEMRTRVPVFRTDTDLPAVIVSGVWKPRILVSDAALSLLTPAELRTALKHETAHVRYFDNLRKLLFRFSAFPGMARLEAAWSEAAEMAADDAAVSNFTDALDLASALIKLSRLSPIQVSSHLTTALLSNSLPLRLERLFAWHKKRRTEDRPKRSLYALLVVTMIVLVSTYPDLLLRVHAVTEWLVR